MYQYKVFLQQLDLSFIEIAQVRYLNDADAVLSRQPSGMITRDGHIVTTKNLMSGRHENPALFNLKETTA